MRQELSISRDAMRVLVTLITNGILDGLKESSTLVEDEDKDVFSELLEKGLIEWIPSGDGDGAWSDKVRLSGVFGGQLCGFALSELCAHLIDKFSQRKTEGRQEET